MGVAVGSQLVATMNTRERQQERQPKAIVREPASVATPPAFVKTVARPSVEMACVFSGFSHSTYLNTAERTYRSSTQVRTRADPVAESKSS